MSFVTKIKAMKCKLVWFAMVLVAANTFFQGSSIASTKSLSQARQAMELASQEEESYYNSWKDESSMAAELELLAGQMELEQLKLDLEKREQALLLQGKQEEEQEDNKRRRDDYVGW